MRRPALAHKTGILVHFSGVCDFREFCRALRLRKHNLARHRAMNSPSFRPMLSCVAVFSLVSLAASSAWAGTSRPYTGTDSTLAIDGVSCGQVTSWQGGEAVGELALDAKSGDTQKKHIANIHYAPITVELGFPLATPVVTWINDFVTDKGFPKTVVLASFKSDRKTVADAIEATSASLLEVY